MEDFGCRRARYPRGTGGADWMRSQSTDQRSRRGLWRRLNSRPRRCSSSCRTSAQAVRGQAPAHAAAPGEALANRCSGPRSSKVCQPSAYSSIRSSASNTSSLSLSPQPGRARSTRRAASSSSTMAAGVNRARFTYRYAGVRGSRRWPRARRPSDLTASSSSRSRRGRPMSGMRPPAPRSLRFATMRPTHHRNV
jgi:hypothetical protein